MQESAPVESVEGIGSIARPYSDFGDSGAADKAVKRFIDDLRPGQYFAISATNLSGVYLGPQTREVWQHLLASCTLVDQVGREE